MWPEMDSLNTKGNVKQKWRKRKKNEALWKTSFRFSLTWKRRIKLATIFPERPKWQMQNHTETSGNSYQIEASQLIYNRNSVYWFCVRRVFAEMFLEQTITIFKSSGWKKLWNIILRAECIEWLPTELTLQHHSTG